MPNLEVAFRISDLFRCVAWATIESALGYGGYAAVLCALAVFVPLILYLPFYITNKLHK